MKTLWEKEKLLVQAISPFPTMFSTLSKTEIIIFVTFNLLSANAFNLVWSKILSRGNGLIFIKDEIKDEQKKKKKNLTLMEKGDIYMQNDIDGFSHYYSLMYLNSEKIHTYSTIIFFSFF